MQLSDKLSRYIIAIQVALLVLSSALRHEEILEIKSVLPLILTLRSPFPLEEAPVTLCRRGLVGSTVGFDAMIKYIFILIENRTLVPQLN
jgi:hypothetical protein